MQGKWNSFFKNDNPIVLELACGRGEYTVGLSALFIDKNFIGVDVKGNRMYIGAKKCLDANINNAAFLRTQITLLSNYFNPAEVDEIWITFPDPQLRTSKSKKRLTHPVFLRLYKQLLQPKGCIHLKTDSPKLYALSDKTVKILTDRLKDEYTAHYYYRAATNWCADTNYKKATVFLKFIKFVFFLIFCELYLKVFHFPAFLSKSSNKKQIGNITTLEVKPTNN
jgi:tRNA (guanine-N(7)-)-methyltransferase